MTLRTILSLISVPLLAAALAACGGGDGAAESAAPPGSPANPLRAVSQEGDARPEGPTDEATAGDPESATREPSYLALVEEQAAKPRERFSPCDLVSADQARQIVGKAIEAPVEAPQGPSCIYRAKGSDTFVTVAVQALDYGRLMRRVESERAMRVAGRAGACTSLGQPAVHVPLDDGRVLSVGAPCRVAAAFAAVALPRLDS